MADEARNACRALSASSGLPLEKIPVSREELLDGIRRAYAAAESMVELVRDLDAHMPIVGLR